MCALTHRQTWGVACGLQAVHMMGAGNSMRWQVSSVVLPGLHMAAAAAEHIRWQVSSVLLPGLHGAAACGGVVTGTVLTAEAVPCLQHRRKKTTAACWALFWRISVGGKRGWFHRLWMFACGTIIPAEATAAGRGGYEFTAGSSCCHCHAGCATLGW